MLCGAPVSQNKDLGQIYGSNTHFGSISLILNCWYNQFQSIWTKTEWVFVHHGNHRQPSWNSELRMRFWFKNWFRIKLNPKKVRVKLLIRFPWKPDQNWIYFDTKLIIQHKLWHFGVSVQFSGSNTHFGSIFMIPKRWYNPVQVSLLRALHFVAKSIKPPHSNKFYQCNNVW